MYHKQGPDGVVEEDGGGYDEHACADEWTELRETCQWKRPRCRGMLIAYHCDV